MVESQQVWIQYQTVPNLKDSEAHKFISSKVLKIEYTTLHWLMNRRDCCNGMLVFQASHVRFRV